MTGAGASPTTTPLRVFLSYQYREKEPALALAEQVEPANAPLEEYDFRMRQQVDQDASAPERERVAHQIQSAAALVCLVGPTTATSSWIDWELRFAQSQGKPVVCMRLDPQDELPVGAAGATIVGLLDASALLELIQAARNANQPHAPDYPGPPGGR